jgi:hypothetical protein
MNFDEQNIIALLGIQSLPDDRKIAILNQMTSLLEKRLLIRMVDKLSMDDQDKLADVMEQNDQVKIQEFIAEHFPEYPNWISEEVNKLKAELTDHIKTIS